MAIRSAMRSWILMSTNALETACNAGFVDIAVLRPAQLSARPQL